jgi:capsular polysaccharide biosynthesis protein
MRSLVRSGLPLPLELDYLSPLEPECLVRQDVVLGPAEIDVPPAGPYRRHARQAWSPMRVHQLRDVTVDPHTGLVFHGGRVVIQSQDFRHAADAAFLSSAYARSWHPDDPPLGDVTPIGGWTENYYHFLVEALPRALLARRVRPEAQVLLGGPPARHVRQALMALDIPYVVVGRNARRAARVTLCDPSPEWWPHPQYLDLLRNLPVGRQEGLPDRVYISRAGSTRALKDEPRLERWLTDRGFTVLRLEELDWADQVAHFRAARIVVAPHGAGLANVVFMRPGAQVLEFTTGHWWNPCFRHIASMAGHDYAVVTLPQVVGGDGDSRDAIAALQGEYGRFLGSGPGRVAKAVSAT